MRIIGAYNTTGATAAPDLQTSNFAQEFVSPLDNLHKVEIMFANPPESHDQPLKAEIRDQSGQIVRTATAVAAKGEKDSFIEFEFAPIENSQDQLYELVIGSEIFDPSLGSENSLQLPPIMIDQALQLKVSDADYYQPGNLYIDGQQVEQDLVFRTFHQIESSYADFVLGSLTSKIKADPVFFSVWLVLILVSMVVAGFGLVRGLFILEK